MVNGVVSLSQRMLIGDVSMMVWRSATRILSFLSDSGWILPLRGSELAEVLRYLNAVLLVAALACCVRFGKWRRARGSDAPPQILRNHFAAPRISVGGRQSPVAAVGQRHFHCVRVDHFMGRQRHHGALLARQCSARFEAKRTLDTFYRRSLGDPAV